jgi:tRNA(Ile2) C34 agmatinyltransferase TiaS
MVQVKPFCQDCGEILSGPTSKCPHCGQRSHKTIAEAYGTPSGLGLFDLVPGVRDLPYHIRKTVMIVFVSGIVGLLILGPTLFRLYHHLNK